jgi:hypothetical protein
MQNGKCLQSNILAADVSNARNVQLSLDGRAMQFSTDT